MTDKPIITVEISNTVETVPSSYEANLLITQIKALAEEISCSSVHHLGSLNDYEDILEKIKTNGVINLDLDIDLSPIQKFADTAANLTELLDNISLKFEQVYKVSFIDDLKKILDYLSNINNMLDKFEDLVIHVKKNTIIEYPPLLKVINQDLDKILCVLNKFIYREANDCDLAVLKNNIREQNHQVKKMNLKLNKIKTHRLEMDFLLDKLSTKHNKCKKQKYYKKYHNYYDC